MQAAQMCHCRSQVLTDAAVKFCPPCRPLMIPWVLRLCRADELEVEHLKDRLDRLSGLFWSVLSVPGRAKTVEQAEIDEK